MSLLILPICSSMLSTYPFSILLIIICFPDGLVKNPPANEGYVSSIPGPRIPPGIGSGNPLQYFCTRNPIDRGPLWASLWGHKRVGHDLATNSNTIILNFLLDNFNIHVICESGSDGFAISTECTFFFDLAYPVTFC